ncbi:hypothetical protein GCM10027037_32480 [Mucilaginibacter koreensis]
MEHTTDDYSHIKGWGVDADPENEPTYPMKHYTGDDHNRINWMRPPLQQPDVEVLQSIERPYLPAVFGNTVPPTGLSGELRRYAFKYSESSYGHWLPLLLADRVNVIEGIVDDLKRGHVPNIFAERGWKADLKYDRKGLATKVLTGVLVTAAVVALFKKKKKKAD